MIPRLLEVVGIVGAGALWLFGTIALGSLVNRWFYPHYPGSLGRNYLLDYFAGLLSELLAGIALFGIVAAVLFVGWGT